MRIRFSSRGSLSVLFLAGSLIAAPAIAQAPDFVQANPKPQAGQGMGQGPGKGQGLGQGSGKDQGPGRNRTPENNQRLGQSKNNGNPSGRGPGNGPDPRGAQGPRNDAELSVRFQFNREQQNQVRNYYHDMFQAGNCPPGLAKKNNGCMPPGQAKRWQRGQPLAPGVVFYELEGPLLGRLGSAPSGHRYVRVDSDILMLSVGTNMVVDAIENLGGF